MNRENENYVTSSESVWSRMKKSWTNFCSRMIDIGSRFDSPNLIHFFSALGGDPNEIDPIFGSTPLTLVCSFGSTHLIEALIASGADPNLLDARGNAPINYAFVCYLLFQNEKLCVNVIKALVENGADVNVSDAEGKRPLDKANEYKLGQVKNLLLQHNALPSGEAPSISIESLDDAFSTFRLQAPQTPLLTQPIETWRDNPDVTQNLYRLRGA